MAVRFEEELMQEFAYTITLEQFIPHRTDAIVVLDYFDQQSTGDIAFRVRNRENIARVRFGTRIWHYLTKEAKAVEPRLHRTAKTCLPSTEQIWHCILGVPFYELPFDITTVKAEINRIIAYSAKGDIARDCRH